MGTDTNIPSTDYLSFTQRPSYGKLEQHYQTIKDVHMRELFADDAERFKKFSIRHDDLIVDFSKNRITEDTMKLLFEMVREADIDKWRERMFSGEKINNTEKRAVLHTALRNRINRPIFVDGENVMGRVNKVLGQMCVFAEKIRSGEWRGYADEAITDVVNIGIGGSDLGPKMICESLSPYRHKRLKMHFLSNVDGASVDQVLAELDPQRTLFIIASKSFATQETMANAHTCRRWFMQYAIDERHIAKHFVAVSTNLKAVSEFGIDTKNMFEFWDWVGGRYSLWSAIGLPIVLSVGFQNYIELLEGAFNMDEHFRLAPVEENLPIILAVLGVWYNNFFDAESQVMLPYDHYLRSLPLYLEQADMESNGKSVDRYGHAVDYSTGAIVWGATGINGQHAFYQLIHQGTKLIPADFIASVQTHSLLKDHHNIMISNFLAQPEALMKGRTLEETRDSLRERGEDPDKVDEERIRQMVFSGNHPSNSILLKKITPRNMGALIAMYEHKIFVQGIIWNLNSYDQWGVELGKQLAKTILPELSPENPTSPHDNSTAGLIEFFRNCHPYC